MLCLQHVVVYLAKELVRVLDTLAVQLLVLLKGRDIGRGALGRVEESGGDGEESVFGGGCRHWRINLFGLELVEGGIYVQRI